LNDDLEHLSSDLLIRIPGEKSSRPVKK